MKLGSRLAKLVSPVTTASGAVDSVHFTPPGRLDAPQARQHLLTGSVGPARTTIWLGQLAGAVAHSMPSPDTREIPMPKMKLKTGVDLYYEEHGKGVPVVLLQGTGFALDVWEPHPVRELSVNHRVITIDPRGIGRSP